MHFNKQNRSANVPTDRPALSSAASGGIVELLPPDSADAAETLARLLYEEIEAIYPGPDPEMLGWGELPESKRIYFRSCVETVLASPRALIMLALASNEVGSPTTT
jgi:hypothetical protein